MDFVVSLLIELQESTPSTSSGLPAANGKLSTYYATTLVSESVGNEPRALNLASGGSMEVSVKFWSRSEV